MGSSSDTPDTIVGLFTTYADGFNRGDFKAIMKHFDFPYLSVHRDGQLIFTTPSAFQKNLIQLLRYYRDIGFERCVFSPAECLMSGEDFACVKLRWTIERGAQLQPLSFHTSYQLRRPPHTKDWKIIAVVAYEEPAICPGPITGEAITDSGVAS